MKWHSSFTKRNFWAAFVVIVIVGLGAADARGQTAASSIYGTVTDPKGAAVPGAKITITNVATRVSRETKTEGDGAYRVTDLPIGTYRVTVEADGFKKLVTDSKTLEINQSLRVDLQMELGSMVETVEIVAKAATVETANYTLGQEVSSGPVQNLPLNGRNVLSLALLQPGVTETNPGSPGQFSVAGGRADSVTFLLDGGVNNNLLSNLVVLNPNPDTVAEFRILTSNYSAEYGRNAGGIVTVVTKSGTNSYHGSVFEFLRNDAVNANTFFNNQQGKPRDILKRNQFGFTVGGPITIPKVIRGQDRFFFFVGYQGQRLVAQEARPAVSVFTPAELQGDFSRSASGGPDPGVVAFLTSHPFFQSDPNKAASGIIDPTKIDPVAQNYIAAGLIPTSPGGQLFPRAGSSNNNDELTGKFDFVVTSKDRLAVTLGSFRNPRLFPFSAEANVPGFPTTTTNHRYFSNIAYTRIFSGNLINEFRFTAQRNNNFQAVPARKLPTSRDLGINIISDDPTGPTQLQFSNKGLTLGFSRQGPTSLVDNTFTWTDTVSWLRGKHSWKFGGTLSAYQNNTVFDFFINGRFRFVGDRFTNNNFADFLIGAPRSYLQFPKAPSNIRTKANYGFVEDEWHVRKNLVLTLGLRYEYSQPKLDTQGRSFTLQLGQQSKVFTKAPLGMLFPGDPLAPVGSNFSDKDDWAPRVGFAWDPRGTGKTSIRGGFGVFYDILKGEDNLQFNGQAPFFGFAAFGFRAVPGTVSAPLNRLSNPFVATGNPNSFPSKPPAPDVDFAKAGFLPVGDAGVFFVDPHLRTPYTYQYNLSIQRELVKDLLSEMSYVGSSSHKLTDLVDANPFILGNPNIVRLYNNQAGVAPDTFSYAPEFRNAVSASYNSMQASLRKRLSKTRLFGTAYFTFAYTYSHGIDNGSGFRQGSSQLPFYNWRLFRGSTDFDVRHRITFSGGWDLPFERAWDSGPKRLTRGWSVYPIVTWRTGFPLDVRAGGSYFTDQDIPGPSGAGDASLVRPNLVGTQVTILDPRAAGNFWFSPSNFTITGLPKASDNTTVTNPALRTYGTLPRNFFNGPARANFDFAMAKTTALVGERINLEFRAEFFNIFNHAQFDDPNTTRTSTQFGKISTTADPRIIQFAVRFAF